MKNNKLTEREAVAIGRSLPISTKFAKEIIDMARIKREELTEEIKSLTKD